MRNRSELPLEILYSISLQIDNPFDLIHFRSVCSSMRSSSLFKFQHIPLDSGGCSDDCHILSSRIYLLKSPNCDCPRYWLFKLQTKENGEVVLHSLFLRRNSSDYGGFVSPSISVNLLNCQIFELAQENMACYSEWFEIYDCDLKSEALIGLDLSRMSNEFMVLGKLSFKSLAMYRSVDQHWTELKLTPDTIFEGIVLFKGDKLLLVEMCTENQYDYEILNIREKKIWLEISELNDDRNDWKQVEGVDGRVLFLEQCCSFSCLANEVQGFRANSVILMNLWGKSSWNDYERF